MTYRITGPKQYYENCLTPAAPADPDQIFEDAKGEKIGGRGPRTLLRSILDNTVILVTSRWNANDIIFNKANQYRMEVESLVAKRVADLGIGITVDSVSLGVKSPPPQTIDAFDEVLKAEIQAGAAKEQAEVYASGQLALAQTEKNVMLADARNYKRRVVSEVEADAAYFKSLLPEYKKNPASVTVALFSQTVSDALSSVKDKFILNALPSGRQELRLKLNPEPNADKNVIEKEKSKEAAK
jgi:regulator of protease activity HflC (stomatin/prohibitin superfamily)